MEVSIEKYRGWEISFDTERESFFVESDQWDQRNEKRSFAACKTFVDEYLKANNTFKPLRVQHKVDGSELLLTGMRKDGRFTYEKNGKKEQLSDYDLSSYIKYNPDNDPKFEAIKKWQQDIGECHAAIKEIREGITGESLKEIQAELKRQKNPS